MGTRTIPDGAGVTNHYTASFSRHCSEAAFISITGLKDEIEVIDGPDKRGYSTGQPTRQTLTLILASHDPAASQMHSWKDACENGTPGYKVSGTVTVMDVADTPVAIYELSDCICSSMDANDLTMDGADVAKETFTVSYSRLKRIGP